MYTIEEDEKAAITPAVAAKSAASAGTALAKDLENRLTLGGNKEEEVDSSPQFSELAPLEQLLRLCGQEVRTFLLLLQVILGPSIFNRWEGPAWSTFMTQQQLLKDPPEDLCVSKSMLLEQK